MGPLATTLARLFGARGWMLLGVFTAMALVVIPLLRLLPPDHPLYLSDYFVLLIGKIMCYAMVALAMDLVWGYAGILSLGHGLFFALGGYAMGMTLMREIGTEGQYQSHLPDYMVFLDWKEFPWYWAGSEYFSLAVLKVMLVPGLLAYRVRLVRVPLAHQGRVFLDHHPGAHLRFHAAVLPQRNRLRRQQRLHRFQAHSRLRARRAGHQDGAVHGHRPVPDRDAAAVPLAGRPPSSAACWPRSATPRDAPCSRGYNTRDYKLFVWTLSAVLCGIAGALYVPQVGIINPSEMSPANSIEIAVWVAVGGRGTLVGAVARRRPGERCQELVHRGVSGLLAVLSRRPVHRRDAVPAARRDGPVRPLAARQAMTTNADLSINPSGDATGHGA